ncbi:hydrogenase expression/formation protein HypE [Dactylosporangium sucinum]|uniref:Hydrogenase expression/formation protein HypE n=1 Tax=Dactylosporangium sucinum TaxID=1424081 RepID=A0A917U9D9_9ACTN|nr:hydrogenase expression/formation protein HypE [Dactylosporangium sucinum]GGM68202.1 hydrogenase expression/formation protein HypE [Dactylosporangium sucinum]
MTAVDPARAACPAPPHETERVLLGHGSGGRLSAELLGHVLLPALGAPPDAVAEDAAVVTVAGAELVLTTDAFVVDPLVFPGGDIGRLAVHGTVNDLAMMGAAPVALALAYIIEEGFPIADLRRHTASAGAAAAEAGVRIATGDTKVVGRGAADGLYVTTTGLGRRLPGARMSAGAARPGDAVLLSGPIGRHGMAILGARESLGFEAEIASDTRSLHRLAAAMVARGGAALHAMRDPTRGGLAAALNEIAAASAVGIMIDEEAVPVPALVAAACDLLGLDPLHVANEGCLVAMVAADAADATLATMRATPEGRDAVRLGTVVADHPGRVVMHTLMGGRRVVDVLVGEQLPRIC